MLGKEKNRVEMQKAKDLGKETVNSSEESTLGKCTGKIEKVVKDRRLSRMVERDMDDNPNSIETMKRVKTQIKENKKKRRKINC